MMRKKIEEGFDEDVEDYRKYVLDRVGVDEYIPIKISKPRIDLSKNSFTLKQERLSESVHTDKEIFMKNVKPIKQKFLRCSKKECKEKEIVVNIYKQKNYLNKFDYTVRCSHCNKLTDIVDSLNGIVELK